MSSFFQRRTNFIVLFIAGAIFFTALGFFVATGVDQPSQTQAQELWTEGSGLSDGQREVPSFAPIAKQMRKSVVRVEAQHLDAHNALAHLLGDGGEARHFALSVGQAGALSPKLLRLGLRRLIHAGGDEEAQSREEYCARNEKHDEVRAALEEGRHLQLLNGR